MLQLEIKPLKFTIRNKTHFRRVFFKNCLYWMRRGWAKNAGKCRTAVSIQGGGYLHSGSPPEAHWREAHCDTQPLPAWCKPKPKPWTLAHSLFNAVLSTYLKSNVYPTLSQHRKTFSSKKKRPFASNEKANLSSIIWEIHFIEKAVKNEANYILVRA